jgi:hypothetical protein
VLDVRAEAAPQLQQQQQQQQQQQRLEEWQRPQRSQSLPLVVHSFSDLVLVPVLLCYGAWWWCGELVRLTHI